MILRPDLPFDLLVFDWDGTLMDSEARIVACMERAIEDINLPKRSREEIKNIIGLGLQEAIDTLFPEEGKRHYQQIIERYRHHYLEEDKTPSQLFAQSEAVVTLLQRDYLLAIATGKGRIGLNKVLAETGIGHLFHISRCADEAFSKPHPQMLLEVMANCGVEAERTLMIGDTEYDMEMGKNAGTATLAVTYGVHAVQRLLRYEPCGTIDDIGELPMFLQTDRTKL
ncbi:MAG: HAD-IA family hydrolase [Gammaproteobacteria bacterium]|nr:HAD-IA family hydrolase [Gammaproteobacteria bacterium]